MPQKDPSKTEKPTKKRIDKQREKGNVAKSQEVSAALTILAGLVGCYFLMGNLASSMMGLFTTFMSNAPMYKELSTNAVNSLFVEMAFLLFKMLMPVLGFIFLVVAITQRLQVGKLWTTKSMKPDLKKMNPINGIKRMFFSLQTILRMLKSLMKVLIIAVAVYLVIDDELPKMLNLYYSTASALAGYMLSVGMKMVIYALVPMVIIAIVDLKYTRWDYMENLKMSKDEVKDERKQSEGDPHVKSQQRQKMMQMSRRRMMQQVPKADIVITNPTHYAVALRYNILEAPAPIVVAKGVDHVAEKIKEIARENRIPIKQNRALARALYSQVEIGDMIPEDLYKAVATLLAELWKTKGYAPKATQIKR